MSKLTTRKLEAVFGAMDDAERVSTYLRLAAADDVAGVGALLRSIPKRDYRMTDATFVDAIDAAEVAARRVVYMLYTAEQERQALAAGGRIAGDMHDRMCEALHGTERMAELRAENAAFVAEHGPSSWWEARDLRMPHLELVMRYERATLAAVTAWQAFERYCAEQLRVDARTTVAAYMPGARIILAALDRAMDDYTCASDPAWLDAFQRHEPLWQSHPEHAEGARSNAEGLFGLDRAAA